VQQYTTQADHDGRPAPPDNLAVLRAVPSPIPNDHSDSVPDGAVLDRPDPVRAELEQLRTELAAAQTKIENLEIALRSSRQIGAAVGVLMHQQRLTQDAAFEVMVAVSQHTQRKLRDIAADVLYTGTLDVRSAGIAHGRRGRARQGSPPRDSTGSSRTPALT
jgi:ANTAR domain